MLAKTFETVQETMKDLFDLLASMVSWIPGMQDVLFEFFTESDSGWTASAKALFLLLPALALYASVPVGPAERLIHDVAGLVGWRAHGLDVLGWAGPTCGRHRGLAIHVGPPGGKTARRGRPPDRDDAIHDDGEDDEELFHAGCALDRFPHADHLVPPGGLDLHLYPVPPGVGGDDGPGGCGPGSGAHLGLPVFLPVRIDLGQLCLCSYAGGKLH